MTNINEENNPDEIKKSDEKELTLEEKLKETEDKLLRSLAEIENQRSRFEKDIKEAINFGGFNFAKENLAILDNLQRAHTSIKNDPDLKDNKDIDKFLKNIEIIEKDLVSIFKKNEITPIECINKKFDPNFHQAMLEIEDDTKDSGMVVQEIQKGYMMKDRLLRPSLVGVSKKKTEKDNDNNKKNQQNEEKQQEK